MESDDDPFSLEEACVTKKVGVMFLKDMKKGLHSPILACNCRWMMG